MPPPIKKLADKFLNNPKHLEVARPASTNANITERLVTISDSRKKRETLRALLSAEDVTTAIIFCNRKTTVRELAKSLQSHRYRASEIHGDMDQSSRIKELDRFKSGDINILVASDVAARGLDIKGVSHVFNFDAPWHPDDYVHRIGRTGRAGALGKAFTLVTKEDEEAIANIEKLTGNKVERIRMAESTPERSERSARDDSRKASQPESRDRAAKPKSVAKDGGTGKVPHSSKPSPARSPERAAKQNEQAPDDGGWNGPVPDFLAFGFR